MSKKIVVFKNFGILHVSLSPNPTEIKLEHNGIYQNIHIDSL